MSSGEEYQSASQTVEVPLDLVHLALDQSVFIKCRGDRDLQGKLLVRITTPL